MLTERDIADIAGHVCRIWPNSDWQPEHVKALFYQVRRMPVTTEQVEAVLVSLAGRSKWKTISVREVADAIQGAANVVVERRPSAMVAGRVRELGREALLRSLPMDLRYVAVARIEAMLADKALTRLGKRLDEAATLAATDWNAALDCVLLRHEVKHHPEVKKWLDVQEAPALDLSTFADVCTAT